MIEPELYEEIKDIQRGGGREMYRNYGHLIKWKTNEDIVLDIGCGPGHTLLEVIEKFLPKRFKTVIGLDISKEMINYAKEKFKEIPFVQLVMCDFSQVDLLVPPLPPIDHVISNFALHWLKDQRKCFKDIYNLLKPGGDLLASFPSDHAYYSAFEQIGQIPEWQGYLTTANCLSSYRGNLNPEKDIENLLKEVGFKNITVTIVDRVHSLKSPMEFKMTLRAVTPGVATMSPETEKKFGALFMDIFKTAGFVHLDEDSFLVDLPYKLCILYCEK